MSWGKLSKAVVSLPVKMPLPLLRGGPAAARVGGPVRVSPAVTVLPTAAAASPAALCSLTPAALPLVLPCGGGENKGKLDGAQMVERVAPPPTPAALAAAAEGTSAAS